MVVVKALEMKLKASGYDVLTAEDGSSAVATARKERPDLIVLDISFPPDVAHGGGVPWDGFLIMGWLRRLNVPIPGSAEAVGLLYRSGTIPTPLAAHLMNTLRGLS